MKRTMERTMEWTTQRSAERTAERTGERSTVWQSGRGPRADRAGGARVPRGRSSGKMVGLVALAACLGLAAAARAAEAPAEPTRVLPDVHFVGSSAELDAEARAILAQHAAWLRDHPDVRVRVVGHTDPVSSPAANQALGARRAEVVRQELVSLGVAAGRIRTASAGAQDPRCMEESLFCETLWKPGRSQQVASEAACPQAPDACFAAERRVTFWLVAP